MYNQGSTVSLSYNFYIHYYPYANGFVMNDPTIFFIVPNGFDLDEKSLTLAGGQLQIKSLEPIIPAGNVGDAVVYKLKLQGKMRK